jgi:zinc transport system substrate-binding protein
MSRTRLAAAAAVTILAAGPALSDVPRVAADIAPVHSLVARVMAGVGEPGLVVPSEATPHAHSLRPSEARTLQDADLVFWVGEALTPWMEDALGSLSADATVVELLEVEGIETLDLREGAGFDAHDHVHGDGAHEGDDHAHDDHAEGDDHGHNHDDHGHGSVDAHAWLDPGNAAVWMDAIAARLSEADPENAAAYAANAEAGRAELEDLTAEVDATLDPVRDRPFIVFHDAYQYFETAFGLSAAGAITLSDASEPSPTRIREVRDRIAEAGVACVLAEPQFNPGLVATVSEGADVSTAVLDPIGMGLEPGAGLYPALLRNLAGALADCL